MLSTSVNDLFHEYFEYRDGHLFWKKKPRSRTEIGEAVGYSLMPNGYMRVGLKGKRYYIHRVIFCMHHGYMPDSVDHKDTNRANNLIDNLRDATSTQNHANQTKRSGLSSKYKGVSWRNDRNKWKAQIKVASKTISLGVFHNEDDAGRAYDQKAIELFGEFAKLNFGK